MKRIILIVMVLLLTPSLAYAGHVQDKIKGVIARKNAGGGACSATYGSELYTSENAAFPSASDFNAITGLTSSGLSSFTAESTGSPYLGTYHILATADSADDRFYQALPALTTDTLYRLSAYVKHSGSGGTWGIALSQTTSALSSVLTQNILVTDTAYGSYDKYFYPSTFQDTLVVAENSGTNDGSVYFDNKSLKEVTSPCLGSELNTLANATSITNEANNTTGWTNTGADTFESTATGTPDNGTYHLLISSNGTPTANARMTIDLSTLGLSDSMSYLISFRVKHVGSGDNWNMGFSDDGWPIDHTLYLITNTETTYATRGVEIVYSAAFRYLTFIESNASNNGGVYVDSLTAKEIVSK